MVEIAPLLRELRLTGFAGALGAFLALLRRELRLAAFPFGLRGCHHLEKFFRRRDEIDRRFFCLRVFPDVERDSGIAEHDARQRMRRELAAQHVPRPHVKLALRHDEHGIAAVVRPDEALEAHVAVHVREKFFHAHMPAQEVLRFHRMIENAGRAIGKRLERKEQPEREAEERREGKFEDVVPREAEGKREKTHGDNLRLDCGIGAVD